MAERQSSANWQVLAANGGALTLTSEGSTLGWVPSVISSASFDGEHDGFASHPKSQEDSFVGSFLK